tara:strand:- start:268 stop:504 length:237 start_codon:yes stop_codon:yes gene_type:complete
LPSISSPLSIINEVKPPDINPKVNEVPIKKPIGRGTVSFIKNFTLCFLLRFCDPRQRKKINNIADAILRVISFNLNNI